MIGATIGIGGGKIHLYAMASHQDKESSLHVITGMLYAFSHDVYALLYPGATLSFITSYVSSKCDILPKSLLSPLSFLLLLVSLF